MIEQTIWFHSWDDTTHQYIKVSGYNDRECTINARLVWDCFNESHIMVSARP